MLKHNDAADKGCLYGEFTFIFPVMKNLFFPAVVALSLFQSFAMAEDDPKVKLVPIYQNLEFERPVSLVIANDGTGRRFLLEQTGKIKILPSDESAASPAA